MFNIGHLVYSLIGNKNKSNATDINILTFNDYYERLQNIALSLFEWKGLPECCNARFLELTLFTYGRALFINDDTLGYMNMRCTPSGELNSYDEPLSYVAYSPVYNHTFRRDECVLIRNNLIERPTNETVLLFASRLTETERTIDVNVKAQKTPNITQCDEKTRLSLLNIWNQYNGNEPLIVADKSLNPDAIKVFKTDAPYVVDKLQIYKQQLWNEVLTFFGINNANNDKRERLITDEVNANNEVIDINADVMLLTRQKACEDINAMYGLNVSVEMRNKKEESEWQDTPLNSEQ